MTIKGVGAGAEASTLPNSNVGSSVSGTYGNLTITSAGAYTYSVSDNSNTIALDAGETATDIFSYKVRDDETNAGSKALDIGIITFTVTGIDGDSEPGKPDDDEKKETKKDKKESKQQRKEEKKAKKKAKRDRKLLAKKFDLPKSSLGRKSEFNQGLKLVDLVAESKSIEIREKDIYVDKVKAKYSEEGLKVKFKVFNDEGKEVQKYYGTMKDGSPLPKWIQVDPKTGKTKTDIPKGVKMVEFKIVAIDEDNNRKQVTVIIDAKKIAKDKEVLKQTRKLTKEKTIEVKNDGVVKLNSIDKDGSIDKTTTNAINDSQSFEDIIQTIEPDEFLKLESNLENNDYVADLPASIHFLIKNDLKTNFENLTIVLKDGKELPSWIKFDKESGKIISNPPKDVNSVDLKIIIKDPAGETIVKDLKINYSKENKSTSEKILDTDNGFITLSAQLSKEHANWDNYGSQLIDSL
jgi:VCBS repeat-containing protein